MIPGNMACGVIGEELIVRLASDDAERALAEPHRRAFDFTDRAIRGFVVVAPEGLAAERVLAGWVDAGAERAASLPPK